MTVIVGAETDLEAGGLSREHSTSTHRPQLQGGHGDGDVEILSRRTSFLCESDAVGAAHSLSWILHHKSTTSSNLTQTIIPSYTRGNWQYTSNCIVRYKKNCVTCCVYTMQAVLNVLNFVQVQCEVDLIHQPGSSHLSSGNKDGAHNVGCVGIEPSHRPSHGRPHQILAHIQVHQCLHGGLQDLQDTSTSHKVSTHTDHPYTSTHHCEVYFY